MLKLPLWDTPVKSYGQKSFFGKSPIVFYIVKKCDPALALGTIFEQVTVKQARLFGLKWIQAWPKPRKSFQLRPLMTHVWRPIAGGINL